MKNVSKMKKVATVCLIVFILLPGSAFHDMLLLMLLVGIWRRELRETMSRWWKYSYSALWSCMAMLTLFLMPRPFSLPTDRVSLVYFNDKGEREPAPLHHWIFNLIFPEETICAMGSCVPLTPLRSVLPIGESILKDYDSELLRGGMLKVGDAYRRNNLALESPLSGTVPQGFNEFFGEKKRAVYVIRPRNFDKDREYPILFFAHGYLGNWKLYSGILRDIEDHIVVCMATEDLSGIFNSRHISEIQTVYLPMLNELGMKVDKDAISIMGLSNGGSATDIAYSSCPGLFRNIIYVSTGVNHSNRVKPKIMIIGGGEDHCAPSMRKGMKALQGNGQRSAFCFDEKHTHLKLLTDKENCLRFLNEELK
ncbi:MAG: hypothetical protein K2J82_11065 [Muribaculaceae bacterium]|nr:hypothetical protein [Muribaculaceae bacterium]